MSKLEEIFENKRREVGQSKARMGLEEIKELCKDLPPCRGFLRSLRDCPRQIGLIAEVKKASPSQGMIRPDFDAAVVAMSYERAGATCLSVLTDERYFGGSPENLQIVRQAVDLPLLRKDFIDDAYQIYEARLWGADAILLIVASLTDAQLQDLMAEATEIGMDVLVEVHTAQEVERANRLKADLIGVNNRDLSTFETDLAMSERLLPMIRPEAIRVSESALSTHEDVERARQAGAQAVLIGTTFCAASDVEAKVKEVMAW